MVQATGSYIGSYCDGAMHERASHEIPRGKEISSMKVMSLASLPLWMMGAGVFAYPSTAGAATATLPSKSEVLAVTNTRGRLRPNSLSPRESRPIGTTVCITSV